MLEVMVAGVIGFGVGVVNGAICMWLFIAWRDLGAAKRMMDLIKRADKERGDDPAEHLYVPEDW